jgi:hypothetical protein
MTFHVVNRHEIEQHVHQLLEQAASFARSGQLPGAVARARWARKELDADGAVLAADEWAAEALRARVEHAIDDYERLLQDWHRQNAARRTAYLKRERAAIGGAPHAQP